MHHPMDSDFLVRIEVERADGLHREMIASIL